MANRVELLPKFSGETKPYQVDFLSELPNGVTISSASVTASVQTGNDSDPQNIVSGSASISGTLVTQVITGGVAGAIYQLIYSAVGSDSNTYQLLGVLAVLSGLT